MVVLFVFSFLHIKTTSFMLLPSVIFKQGGSLLSHLNTKLDFISFTGLVFMAESQPTIQFRKGMHTCKKKKHFVLSATFPFRF